MLQVLVLQHLGLHTLQTAGLEYIFVTRIAVERRSSYLYNCLYVCICYVGVWLNVLLLFYDLPCHSLVTRRGGSTYWGL